MFSAAVAGHLAPLLEEMKKLRKENKKQIEKTALLQSRLTATQAMVKEVLSYQSKGKPQLKTLLKADGAE